MEKLQLHYSKKTIPILSETNDKWKLKEKIKDTIECMRCLVQHEDILLNINPNDQNIKQTYGLKTFNYPIKIGVMVSFKRD